jgi:hypothetical protein
MLHFLCSRGDSYRYTLGVVENGTTRVLCLTLLLLLLLLLQAGVGCVRRCAA